MQSKPHYEGYAYQDCLCAYFILKEILEDSQSSFKIDLKENDADKFDDLTIINKTSISKKQIKYSSPTVNRSLTKSDISSSNYDLAIDTLFNSWKKYDKSNIVEFRLCLAWNEPTDELKDILDEAKNVKTSFASKETKIFRINLEKLWPSGKGPLSNWKRLKKASQNVNRNEFNEFCEQLLIELNFPKFSLDINNPGMLENILFEQVRILGVGEYPNNHLTIQASLLRLFYLIRACRSKGITLTNNDVLQYLNIRTDYGEIRQFFPINENANILTKNIIDDILISLADSNLVLLVGEPGSGKSWAIENLTRVLNEEGENVVKYYCYTSLEDELLKERIKTDTLYGSIMAEILKIFPDLKKYKELKYASNLSELNLLLDKIDENIYLIIDGLDHINRIYDRYKNELTENDVDIINKISKIKFNKRVKCLLVSQPIRELDNLNEYKKLHISKWTQPEIIVYLNKHNIPDTIINDVNLSALLLNKSEGNPLYLNYIVEELKKIKTFQENDITNLPSYSYNLQNYYSFLLRKSELHQDIPRILSGASFRLNKNEIKKITQMGDIVDSSLEILSPVLKSNSAKHGYAIYHESFRRYIIDYLHKNDISIIDKVYTPLINWLNEEGFYSNYKSYRYYLPLLLECNNTKEIINQLTYDFLIRSVGNGYSWQLIKNNCRYLLYASVKEKDFPSIILLTELNHILISTESEFETSFGNYFDALGNIKGFDHSVSYLSFEDRATLSPELGIHACYICDIHGVTPPWDLYWEYFKNKNEISLDDFRIIVRYNFTNNLEHLKEIIKDLTSENNIEYIEIFKNEFDKYHEQNIKEELLQEMFVRDLFDAEIIIDNKLEELISKVVGLQFIAEGEVETIKNFFHAVKKSIQEKETNIINYLIDQLKLKNWFYNWIIYYLKIIQIKHNPVYTFAQLKDAFQYLIYDTDPFKGKPRTCDLYKLEGYIHTTLAEGLSLINKKEEWCEILDILIVVSEKTTTSLQRTLGGPLSTNDFLILLEDNVDSNNIDKIISIFENTIEKEKDYNLYSYTAEYNFRLSKLYSKVNNITSAEACFIRGTQYLLSYTFRKDTTLEELIESIEGINTLDEVLGSEHIKKIKILAETVINHTDGKGTRHFPVSWFSKYLQIDFSNALLFLLNSMSETRYHWRLEECLIELINKSQGSINPLLELFLLKTFPIENSEEYLTTSIYLTEKIESDYPLIAKNSYGQLLTKYEIEQHSSDKKNEEIYDQLSSKLRNYGIEVIKSEMIPTNEVKREYNESGNIDKKLLIEIINKMIKPDPISDLDDDNLIIYLRQNEINDGLINSLIYYFETKNELTEELKDIIRILVLKDKWSRGKLNDRLKIIFDSSLIFSHYFLICRYIYEIGGWYESLINQDAFLEAYRINSGLTLAFLFELLNDLLSKNDYNRLLSANLINTLIKVNFDKDIIIKAWKNLFNIIDFRLPDQEHFDWVNVLIDEYDMSNEERLISILFTRLKINTSERHNYAILGILILLRKEPLKLIKPFKWFFKNFNDYLEITQTFLLELLWFEGEEIHKDLVEELKSIYPTNHYSIDYLIELILNLPQRKGLINTSKLIYPNDDEASEFYKNVNIRFEILERMGFDLSNVYGEFKTSFGRHYNKYFELTYNRVHKKNVRIIYNSNYFFRLINANFYYDFRNCKSNSPTELFHVLKIDYRTLLSQHSSICYRPNDLRRPSKTDLDFFMMEELPNNNGWIRLGHFETELYEDSYASGLKEFRCFGGMVFNDNLEKGLPYSQHRLNPLYIWHPEVCTYESEDFIVCSFLQLEDFFEYYKILWLNPILINKLNLRIGEYAYGLLAYNDKGEIILRYNSWYADYVWHEGIDGEIPKLDGCELLIREDYFQRILKFFDNKSPQYYVLKIS